MAPLSQQPLPTRWLQPLWGRCVVPPPRFTVATSSGSSEEQSGAHQLPLDLAAALHLLRGTSAYAASPGPLPRPQQKRASHVRLIPRPPSPRLHPPSPCTTAATRCCPARAAHRTTGRSAPMCTPASTAGAGPSTSSATTPRCARPRARARSAPWAMRAQRCARAYRQRYWDMRGQPACAGPQNQA